MISVSKGFRAHVMKFVSWRKNLCYRSGHFGCMLLLPLLLLLGHMCKVRKNAGAVSGRCMRFASAHPKCVSRGCVYVWGVFCHRICQPARSQASNGLRKRLGVEMGEIPPPLKKKRKKKCGFIAACLGQRVSSVSLPHHDIISWALSTERNMARRQRGREEELKIEQTTQSGNTRRRGRRGGKMSTTSSTLFSIKSKKKKKTNSQCISLRSLMILNDAQGTNERLITESFCFKR